MSRKDYELTAKALANSRPIALSEAGKAQKAQWENCCYQVAQAFEKENSQFNKIRFLKACGVEVEVRL